MHIVFIEKHKYPKDIFSNEQDMKTWRSMASHFDRLFIIAQSPNLFFYKDKENNIAVYLVPNLLGYFGFIVAAVKLGFYLNLRYCINVFDASEVAGGGIAATILKFLTGKPTVIEVQGEIFRGLRRNNSNLRIYPNSTNYYKSLLLQKIGYFAMKYAARIRVISRAVFNQVLAQGIPADKIRLVSLRVDLRQFNTSNISTSDVYSFGDNTGIIRIGYIGRLVDGKGLEDLLRAVANLNFSPYGRSPEGRQVPNFQLLIYGTGLLEERLKKMAIDLGIGDKIEWRGFAPYGKVPEALAQIDIFVYPSWHEGFGRSIMEALAMEKAVVATNVGGIPDLIKDGENGFLVEPHKPEKLAEKIKILIENKELREKLGKAGREWVTKNFEWNDGIKKFANLFLELK